MEKPVKSPKELILEALKEANTRGGFVAKDFEVEATLQKQPISIKGKVCAKINGNQIEASETETIDVVWNLQGRCIKGNNAALDLVITL